MANTRTPNLNIIGQASQPVADLTANMNNRLLASMQEAGATQRQGMANNSQQIVAGIGEQGATNRAQITDTGETRRAGIAAKVAQTGQQAQVQMNREQVESSDAQNAAQIRAGKEAREFQARQQESLVRLDDELEWARMRHREAIAREDKAAEDRYRQQVLDLERDASLMNFGMQMMNYQSTMRMIQQLYGKEEADARMEDGLSKVADQARVAQKVSQGLKPAAQARAQELGANKSLGIDQVVAGIMSAQGFAVSRDTVRDKAKLAEFLDAKGLEGYLAYRTAVEAAKEQRTVRKEDIAAGKVKASEVVPNRMWSSLGKPKTIEVQQSPGGAGDKAVDADLNILRQMEMAVSEMAGDKTPLPDGKGTRGKQMLAWDAYHRGDTISGVALDQKNRGLTAEQSRMETLDFYMNGANDTNGITQYLYQIGFESADVERFRSRMAAMTQMLQPGQAPAGMLQAGIAGR